MGCGASVHDEGGQAVVVASPDAVSSVGPSFAANATAVEAADEAAFGGNWATKTSEAQVPRSGFARGDVGCIAIVDADNDDEIELVYESGPDGRNGVRGQAAVSSSTPSSRNFGFANAQEAPDTVEETRTPTVQNSPLSNALSKRQQEESAKLAEQRKRFDNQRYQRGEAESGAFNGMTAASSPAFGSTPQPMGYPAPAAVDALITPHSSSTRSAPPKTEMVMGLNLAGVGDDRGGGGGCLPGGVADDTPRQDAKPVFKSRNHHDDFDDNDERLMNEILESVDF